MDDIAITKPSARPLDSSVDVRQFQFGLGVHDSTQYNFFAEDKFFSVRVVETLTTKHYSAWLYDNGVVEVVNSADAMERIGSAELNLKAPQFELRADDERGSTVALSGRSNPVFEIDFTTPIAVKWGFPGQGYVIHQPLIQADISYGGQAYKGIGYCKRAWYDERIGYWGWRFVEGAFGGGRSMVWTADATFGHSKYDYFRIARAEGTVEAAENIDSRHRDDAAYGEIDGTSYEVRIAELGTWQTQLAGERMDTKLRQRFCEMTVTHDGEVEVGYALNETGIGTVY
jgi:hypothetical protein